MTNPVHNQKQNHVSSNSPKPVQTNHRTPTQLRPPAILHTLLDLPKQHCQNHGINLAQHQVLDPSLLASTGSHNTRRLRHRRTGNACSNRAVWPRAGRAAVWSRASWDNRNCDGRSQRNGASGASAWCRDSRSSRDNGNCWDRTFRSVAGWNKWDGWDGARGTVARRGGIVGTGAGRTGDAGGHRYNLSKGLLDGRDLGAGAADNGCEGYADGGPVDDSVECC